MRKLVDINSWNRKDHYNFFKNFDEPFYGIVANVDSTFAYNKAKKSNGQIQAGGDLSI